MNHKLTLLLSGALALTVLFAACGEPQGGVSPSPSPSVPVEPSQQLEASPTSVPAEPSPTAPTGPSDSAGPSQQPEASPTPTTSAPESADPEALKELAMTFIDKSVEELIAAIGEPSGSDYAPSCLGDGEDGELFYDGFSVYTYREGDVETVQDVL